MADSLVEIQKKNFHNYSYNLKVVKNPLTWNHEFQKSAIIFCQQIEFLFYLQHKSKLKNQSFKDMKFLVIFGHEFFVYNSTSNAEDSDKFRSQIKVIDRFSAYQTDIEVKNLSHFMINTYVQKSLNLNFGLISQFQYFLIATENIIYLTTIEWFNKFSCNHFPILYIINTLNKLNGKWTTELKNYEKFRNFNGCKLIHFHLKQTHDYLFNERDFIKVILFDILAQKGNFESVHLNTESKEDYYKGNVYLAAYINLEPDIFPVHTTSTFTSFTLEFFTTPGELYTSYEKLLMPFDRTTWCLLIITFCTSFVMVLLLNLLPQRMKRFVNFEVVNTPALNIMSVFFGIPMRQFPSSSLWRYFFTLVLFFCLIFRTAYQGLLFELMTSDKHKSTPQTINELVKMNYTIYATQVLNYYDLWLNGERK